MLGRQGGSRLNSQDDFKSGSAPRLVVVCLGEYPKTLGEYPGYTLQHRDLPRRVTTQLKVVTKGLEPHDEVCCQLRSRAASDVSTPIRRASTSITVKGCGQDDTS